MKTLELVDQDIKNAYNLADFIKVGTWPYLKNFRRVETLTLRSLVTPHQLYDQVKASIK